MQSSNQPVTKNKYVYETPIACFRSGIVDQESYGVLVLIPGHQNHQFGYYIASERQIEDTWVYYTYEFVKRVDDNTYRSLLDIIIQKHTEVKVANV